MTKINTILQCFVDLNLETDENSGFFIKLPKVSFEKKTYFISEGQKIDVKISLDSPSTNGSEEVQIGLVINNTNASDFSTLTNLYPQTISFSPGEQTKIFSFFANSDSLLEGIESFDLILASFSNVNPGQFITTTVNIIDFNNLKSASINIQGGVVSGSNSDGIISFDLKFSAFEGSTKNIILSLDSPSVFGFESVDVQFSNITTNSSDYSLVGTSNISWAIGEKDKVISIKSNSDANAESTENLIIKLINPKNVNIVTFDEATFSILDATPSTRYATANFQGFYIQKGDSLPNIELRHINRNTVTEDVDNTWRMSIKFGNYIEQNWRTFNPPRTSASAPKYGINSISGYISGQDDNLQKNAKIFFGKNPETQKYGDLRLRIKNVGNFPAKVNNISLSTGQTTTIAIDNFDFKIKLPANDNLLSGGTFYEGGFLSQNTLTECVYEFVFEVDYEELGFKLRNSDNTISMSKEFNLGTYRFNKTFLSSDADIPSNFYNLVSELKNVWPYWKGNNTWPNPAPYCLAPGNISNPDPVYPTYPTDLQNVMIDGVIFLNQNLSNFNGESVTKTEYGNFYFLNNGQTAASSGCSSVNIQSTNGVINPQLQTQSIPFVVV